MAFLLKRLLSACVAVVLVAAGCSRGGAAHPVTIGQCAQDCPLAATAVASATPGFASAPVLPAATPGAATGPASATPAAAGCDFASRAQVTFDALTPEQRIGQLFMVGLRSGDDPSATLATISDSHSGNVVLYGTGWSSAATVAASAASVQSAAAAANGGVMAFVGGNQEGGEHGSFQAFYGPGFNDMPSALKQGALPAAILTNDAQTWGQQLRAAGVNLDLAPVMDVVDQATAQQNGPIGQYDREFGYDPATVARAGVAFIAGMQAAGEPVSIKHFPGLGRVQGNTDFTAQATIDNQLTSAADPNLKPFKDGIAARTDMVMVGSATYPNYPTPIAGSAAAPGPAMFSTDIIAGLLRGALGFNGVVISDDVGAAASVAGFQPEQRAVLFLRAGGDIVLTVQPSDIAPMTAEVLARVPSDPAFAQKIDAAALRVLTLKAHYGMLPPTAACPAPSAPATPAQRTTQTGR